ncbi:MAG: hypothetical protein DMF55_07690 [Acidobacteria bacterium]|nr:MAG: hypothetical protein DMF55_07690 [Acidobacteriota bacterium]
MATATDRTRWDSSEFTHNLADRVWTASSVVRRYLHRLASGNDDADWWTTVASRHVGDFDPLLVLGCGSGGIELLAVERGVASRVLACDLSLPTLEAAERSRRARNLGGVHYFQCNLDRPQFPVRTVRLAIAHDCLHHVQELELLFQSLHRLLQPNGTLAFCEYTGPNRFQYPDEQLEVINRYLAEIPRHLRVHPDNGEVVEKITRTDSASLIREDPSEAVRSEDVVAAVLERFTRVVLKPYNGGLLNPLLQNIIVNFHSEEGRALLEYLCEQERLLTESGELAPNFTLFEGRPK